MQLYILHFQRETFAQAIDLVGYNNHSCCEYRLSWIFGIISTYSIQSHYIILTQSLFTSSIIIFAM